MYIFIILQKNLEGVENPENNFVHFLRVWDRKTGGSYGKYFILDASGCCEASVWLDCCIPDAAAGLRKHVTSVI